MPGWAGFRARNVGLVAVGQYARAVGPRREPALLLEAAARICVVRDLARLDYWQWCFAIKGVFAFAG